MSTILLDSARRLGINDANVLRKAEEFLRILGNKCTIRNVNDIAKTVLILELSATYVGATIDKDTAITLSGLRKTQYRSNLHMIEKLLDVCKPVSVSELCVILSCTAAKEAAEEIWSKYKKSDNKIKDLTHPQYVTASVYTACKLKDVKVDKQQCIQASHLKPSQWKELTQEFEKFVEEQGLGNKRKPKEKTVIVKNSKEDEIETIINTDRCTEEEEIEEYEVWKNRILKEAREALKLNTK